MSYITQQQVQQWLNTTKLTVADVDVELEATAQQIVFSAIPTEYDTTLWVDDDTTPQLIQRIISMFVAAWIWKRAAEGGVDLDSTTWGVQLEEMAYRLLGQVADGTMVIPGGTTYDSATGQPSFYPTDAEEEVEGQERKFSMGTTF